MARPKTRERPAPAQQGSGADLSNVTIQPPKETLVVTNQDHCIGVVENDSKTVTYMCASDAGEAREWMRAIQTVARKDRARISELLSGASAAAQAPSRDGGHNNTSRRSQLAAEEEDWPTPLAPDAPTSHASRSANMPRAAASHRPGPRLSSSSGDVMHGASQVDVTVVRKDLMRDFVAIRRRRVATGRSTTDSLALSQTSNTSSGVSEVEQNRLRTRLAKLAFTSRQGYKSEEAFEQDMVPWRESDSCVHCNTPFGSKYTSWMSGSGRHHCRLCGRCVCLKETCANRLFYDEMVTAAKLEKRPPAFKPKQNVLVCVSCENAILKSGRVLDSSASLQVQGVSDLQRIYQDVVRRKTQVARHLDEMKVATDKIMNGYTSGYQLQSVREGASAVTALCQEIRRMGDRIARLQVKDTSAQRLRFQKSVAFGVAEWTKEQSQIAANLLTQAEQPESAGGVSSKDRR
ncbi:uncharacterized protein MONBRDRAFT_28418 [Monosiga brevicollis MX1]|uniref:FYVE-type domain-containing protein n=1 Tax=Monosiga brevicollis TaxID=81824 RepID=A9V843_MONBE|nr:uncharacterized protein MONBRDRAFT_28418 [Monosiga brevicollis MX1]EDQ86205.1 predicted protein [Monosiga brevicollis MX1]|eukprot:XP_001748875.1 hypothetical protein [Monosiga brevicollis MX1]